MSKKVLKHSYDDIISLENLLLAWQEFKRGKRERADVQIFERDLMSNIISLNQSLKEMSYKHSVYEAFNISDPKPRNIHKANVRDRVLHRALYRKLYSFFDETFIADSYSCRLKKGTHRALNKFNRIIRKVSKNNTRTAWALKCDIRKFFASISQNTLIGILDNKIVDKKIVWLLEKIIKSFNAGINGTGLPLGNLTSQLFANVYMNEFDQFVKHKLKIKHYIRYADDFVVLSEDRRQLQFLLPQIRAFLSERLHLNLHPQKISIKTVASGVDFLGWVHFQNYRILRTATKRRMFRGIKNKGAKDKTIQSYFGLLSYGNTRKIKREIEGIVQDMASFGDQEKVTNIGV
jgi:retron-type reverse transcriptase